MDWSVGHVHTEVPPPARVCVVTLECTMCACGIAGDLLLAACQNDSRLIAGCTAHMRGHVFIVLCETMPVD